MNSSEGFGDGTAVRDFADAAYNWRREYRDGAFVGRGTSVGFVPLVVENVPPTRGEVSVVPAAMETIDITLTNGRQMTIPDSLAPVHLAALLAVLDP